MTARRVTSGEPLTLLLIAVSTVGGIALAIACSYRPIALWWVMVGCSAINLVRLGARQSRPAGDDRAGAPATRSPLGGAVTRVLSRPLTALARARPGSSQASLDRQHRRFLVWFAEHNLLWTTVGFGVSLLLWYRFGPTTPALVVMAGLMSCALFAALGVAAGASAPTLGLCWREPCRMPDLLSVRRLVHDIGCVVVLTNRRDYAARCDWAKGARFHELFLTVDDLARAGVEPGLETVLVTDDPAVRRTLARKERLDRAVALTPVLVAALLAALVVVPPLAGSEPLPSLWTIVTRTATAQPRAAANADGDSQDQLSGAPRSSGAQQPQKRASDQARSRSSSSPSPSSPSSSSPSSPRAEVEATSQASRAGHERPDITGAEGNGEGSVTGDGVASARGESTEGVGGGAGAPRGEGAGAGNGSLGPGGRSSSGDDRSGGSGDAGGRGSGPQGYGTGGVAPQRAESPNALPDAPVSPGKAIEVVLPAFSQARDETPGDDPTGTKRKATASDDARAAQARRDIFSAPNEPATRQPVQRLPNWIHQLLHR